MRKFFLHVSKEEQQKRFLERLDLPEKNWKFSANDAKERGFWDDYMKAYEETIRETATEDSPWYVVPADNKWFTRVIVAAAVIDALASLDLSYPKVSAGEEEGTRRSEEGFAREQMSATAASDDDAPARPSRWSGIVPAARWLRSYQPAWLRADLVAGITLAAYLLPAGAGRRIAGQPAARGGTLRVSVWRDWSSGCFAVRGTRRSRSRPPFHCSSARRSAELPAATRRGSARWRRARRLLVALIAFIAWLVKAGSIVNFISESVMIGFKCGVALFLASTQLPKLFGIHGAHGNFWENSGNFLHAPGRNQSHLAHDWRRRAGGARAREDFSQEQTGGVVRGGRRHSWLRAGSASTRAA